MAGTIWLGWAWDAAVLAAFIATLLHYLSELWRQLGHARVARRAGRPMSEAMFTWVLAASLYPRDEPELPARIHIRRALVSHSSFDAGDGSGAARAVDGRWRPHFLVSTSRFPTKNSASRNFPVDILDN